MTTAKFKGKGGLRHTKIVGDFGEHLILYWLSKHGYECVHVDHVGIDLIAARPDSSERLGVSVKSRDIQRPQSVGGDIVIAKQREEKLAKVYSACEAFACAPYLAVVLDQNTDQHEKKIYGFMTPFEHFLAMHSPNTKGLSWKWKERALESYRHDDKVKMFECDYQNIRWP